MANEEMMLRHTLGLALALATLACAVSCGSDTEQKPATNNVTPDAGGVLCGPGSCPPIDGVTEPPCCQEPFLGKCGIQRGAGCVDPPMTADPRCPSVPLPGGIGNLTSCCTPDGQCGISPPAAFGGGGCTELGEARRRAQMYIGDSGFSLPFPEPKPCDG
jgi:hypothetical protein